MAESLENVRLRATRFLARFIDPALAATRLEMVLELKPRPEDYARVFTPDVAEAVQGAYSGIWQSTPVWRIRPDQTFLRVFAATVPELRDSKGEAPSFPGGYREAAPFLVDGPVWICWELQVPAARAGMTFDGLVPFEDERWAWFPKPWRALPKKKVKAVSHWSE